MLHSLLFQLTSECGVGVAAGPGSVGGSESENKMAVVNGREPIHLLLLLALAGYTSDVSLCLPRPGVDLKQQSASSDASESLIWYIQRRMC